MLRLCEVLQDMGRYFPYFGHDANEMIRPAAMVVTRLMILPTRSPVTYEVGAPRLVSAGADALGCTRVY